MGNDVVQALDLVAHELCRARRFFGDRQIGRAGGGDEDAAFARRDVFLTERDDACIGVIRRLRHDDSHGVVRGLAGARDSSVDPRPTISAAIAAIWAGVLPRPRTTSGKPWRMAR